jgi:hypothetical protein
MTEQSPWDRGIWGCRRGNQCKWKGRKLSSDGIALGIVPHEADTWRQWHERTCGGELVQIVEKEQVDD